MKFRFVYTKWFHEIFLGFSLGYEFSKIPIYHGEHIGNAQRYIVFEVNFFLWSVGFEMAWGRK